MKITVVVQARMGSTRLPGKVLMPLAGKPLLVRMMERLQAASTPSELIVATTTETADEPIRECCGDFGYHCFSGHPTDLLDRHYQAGLQTNADVIVKIPSDCPLIDPEVVDRVIGFYCDHASSYDFVSNLHPPTWPDGQDVEVIPIGILEHAWREATLPMEREHTTPFIWERGDQFRLGNVVWETGLNYSMTHRWTIDYPEDYRFLVAVYQALWMNNNSIFGVAEILHLLDSYPEIGAINSKLAGINWYRNHLNELKTVDSSMTREG